MHSFLVNNNSFEAHSWEHFISVMIFSLIGAGLIFLGRRTNDPEKRRTLVLYFTFSIFLAQLAKVIILLSIGQFDATEDLPFQLCNIAPFILWLAYYLRSRVLWGVIFMWIMAGTLQANFTPNLHQAFPHFEWFRYWIIHVWLIISILYGIILLDYRLVWQDIFRSLFWLNIFALIMYPVNKVLNANYLFLINKPDAKSMYDLLGDWPYYIFQLEFVALFLFTLLFIPFFLHARYRKSQMLTQADELDG